MKRTIDIDDNLLRKARSASGARSDTEAVRRGLEALVRQVVHKRLRALRGTEPRAVGTRRRREPAFSSKRSTA